MRFLLVVVLAASRAPAQEARPSPALERAQVAQAVFANRAASPSLEGLAVQILSGAPAGLENLDGLGARMADGAPLEQAVRRLSDDYEAELSNIQAKAAQGKAGAADAARLERIRESRFLSPTLGGGMDSALEAVSRLKESGAGWDGAATETGVALPGAPGAEELKAHFASRRAAVMERVPGRIVLPGGKPKRRNGDNDYAFRQDSDFLYLTGSEEPHQALVLDGRTSRQQLLVPEPSRDQAVWEGETPTTDDIRNLYGLEGVYRKGAVRSSQSRRLRKALAELRQVKTPTEVALIQKAAEATSLAHTIAMHAARAGQTEYQVQAAFERALRDQGLAHVSYDSIVGAGPNAAVLHYARNGWPRMGKTGRVIRAGDFILIDAAGEFMGYAADVTRTFPASGRFSPEQRALYSAVLAAQKEVIAKAGPGVAFGELENVAAASLTRGLRSMGLIRGDDSPLLREAVGLFYPHGVSHMLGLDVHDPEGKGPLKPGNVITVEPGLYFIPALLRDPAMRRKFAGVVDFARADQLMHLGGVRIEDDLLITGAGNRNLTTAPKEIEEIEALRSRP